MFIEHSSGFGLNLIKTILMILFELQFLFLLFGVWIMSYYVAEWLLDIISRPLQINY